jgi:hypothetical protein
LDYAALDVVTLDDSQQEMDIDQKDGLSFYETK